MGSIDVLLWSGSVQGGGERSVFFTWLLLFLLLALPVWFPIRPTWRLTESVRSCRTRMSLFDHNGGLNIEKEIEDVKHNR